MARTEAELAAIARDCPDPADPHCLRCGKSILDQASSVHHRKLKGRKTPKEQWDRVENLVVVCGSGTTGCHSWIHDKVDESLATGWMVRSWDNPAEKACHTLDNRMLMLTEDGRIVPAPMIKWEKGQWDYL